MANTNTESIIYFYMDTVILWFSWLANCEFSMKFTFTFIEGKTSKNYPAEEARSKCYPVSENKIERLSYMWKQDEKIIQPLKGVSNDYQKARWKSCPVKTKLISNPLFVYSYGYITDSGIGYMPVIDHIRGISLL